MTRPTIAVDALGGDHAPEAVVAGAVAAARDLDVAIQLVGPTALVADALARAADAATFDWRSRITQLEAPDVIGMDEAPLAALRRKPGASIKVAVDAVARGEADACYSAGHTGATLLAAHAAFGLLEGADRPALAVLVPTLTGQAVLLDTGATLDCRPEHLRAFAMMGAAYARVVLKLDDPRVGLLSIGEEPGKGNDLIRDAHAVLSVVPGLTFGGNIDARDMFSGGMDVIVTDGFTGNVALKVGEGLVDTLERMLKREVGQSMASRIANWLVGREFKRLKARMDAGERGGAPLLGVNGLAIVAHGRSEARAVRNGIATAAQLVREGLVGRLRDALRMGR